jgi:GH35 family endo-1,4-beta-xylanase
MRFLNIIFCIFAALCIFFSSGCFEDSKDDPSGISIRFGAAVGPDYLDEADYSGALKKYFDCVVAENHMKWELIAPNEVGYNFADADKIVNFAVDNGMAVRGHTLLWHRQLPAWVKGKTYGELDDVLENHINAVVGRYKGKIYAWDVVNEIIMSSAHGLRNNDLLITNGDYSVWSETSTDDSLIRKAFEFAHAADPDAKLFVNDENSYGGGPYYENHVLWNQMQSDLLYSYVLAWVSAGVPVHGVGMQLHLDEGNPPVYSMIENDIIRYGALGLEVHFTEIDVRIEDPVTAEKLQNQAVIYNKIAQLAMKYPSIVTSFVTWGVSDKYSWIGQPGYFDDYSSALLFDAGYNPKPAYNLIKGTLGL